jgi:nitrogen fixation NifU-like protein
MDLNGLYQEIILDHYKHPRGKAALEDALASAHHVNPTCGDEVTVDVATDADGRLRLGYQGQGCSISQASASVMAELLEGASVDDSVRVREAFVAMMHSQGNAEPDEDIIGDGVAFVGVAKYPARVKCALLPWMALQDAEIKAGLMAPKEETR